MKTLPVGIESYAQSPHFTSTTVPAKLLSVHDLKAGTWGQLNVLNGTVTYIVFGQTDGVQISAGDIHIVPPEEKHFITVSEGVEFFIEFCAAPKPKTE